MPLPRPAPPSALQLRAVRAASARPGLHVGGLHPDNPPPPTEAAAAAPTSIGGIVTPGRTPGRAVSSRAARALQAIYDELPAVTCKGLCSDSCTAIDATALERSRLAAAGVNLPPRPSHARVLQLIEQGRTPRCPGLSAIGTCRVYEIRPTICRVFGAAAGLRCEHGCVPERVMPDAEVYQVMARVQQISDREARQR